MSSPFGEGNDGGADGGTVGAAGQESGVGDSATLADSQQSQTSDTGNSGSGYNPAWDDVLKVVPTQFHSVFEPKLKEWDQNYNKLAQEYAPYKQFSERGLDADTLTKAFTLYQMIDQNPQEIYRRLGEALGQQVQQAQGDDEEISYDEDEGEQGQVPNDPRYDQLQQQFMAIQQQNTQLQQQYLEGQYSQQIDTEIKGLLQQHGQFDVPDVMNRFLAQMQRGENPSITKAYQEQQQFIQNYNAANQQKRPAPQILSPNGGIPSGQEQIPLKTQEDRVAAIKKMIDASNQ